jgi:hypothetical protein
LTAAAATAAAAAAAAAATKGLKIYKLDHCAGEFIIREPRH